MTSIAELKVELQDAKSKLRYMRSVSWNALTDGMNDYSCQLAIVTRLTNQLNQLQGGKE